MLLIIAPVLPHLASEGLEKLNYKEKLMWPEIEKRYLVKEKCEIVIQVNGKKRKTLIANKDIDEKQLIKTIKDQKLIDKYIDKKTVLRTIFVKQRLINYLIK